MVPKFDSLYLDELPDVVNLIYLLATRVSSAIAIGVRLGDGFLNAQVGVDSHLYRMVFGPSLLLATRFKTSC